MRWNLTEKVVVARSHLRSSTGPISAFRRGNAEAQRLVTTAFPRKFRKSGDYPCQRLFKGNWCVYAKQGERLGRQEYGSERDASNRLYRKGRAGTEKVQRPVRKWL